MEKKRQREALLAAEKSNPLNFLMKHGLTHDEAVKCSQFDKEQKPG